MLVDQLNFFHYKAAYVVAKKLGGIFIWSIDMDDFSGKFCDLGSFPLIKNSMSLLMDYLPEWYSSNVNQPTKSTQKSSKKQAKLKNQEHSNPLKVFYVLKNELTSIEDLASSAQSEQEIDLVKQNRIRNDLMMLLTKHPQKFFSLNLPDTFSCINKQRGMHRDPFDCTKYYFCDESSTNLRVKVDALECPKKSMFNMNGCFCDPSHQGLNCEFLNETFCDLAKFKESERKFSS